ncbi:MAG: hypothetical protein M1835_004626 [Candelina submexicana]|nr:MAG: hypothetical protein M1835_004626 [Candelina submexicana]
MGRPSIGQIQSHLGFKYDPEGFERLRASFNDYHNHPSHTTFFAMTLNRPEIDAEVHTFLAAGAGYQYWPASQQTDGNGDRLVYPADLARITRGVKYLASYGRLVHNATGKRLATEANASSKARVRSGSDRKKPSKRPREETTHEAKGDDSKEKSDEESENENPDFTGRRGVALAIAMSKLGQLSLRFKGDEREEIMAMKAEIDETITRIIDSLRESD